MRSAALDFPVFHLGHPADAGPAVLLHGGEVLEALEVYRHIGALFLGSLLADGEGLVDVVDAAHFQVVGAGGRCEVGSSQGEEGEK